MEEIELNKTYCEDCVNTMDRMKDNFIDLTVTSPPYDLLREYNGFSFDFENIANNLFRVTAVGGVIVWIVGDACEGGTESGTSFRQALYFMKIGFNLHDTMIYKKKSPAYPAGERSNRYGQVFEYMFVFSKGSPKTANLLKDKKNIWAGTSSFGTVTERLKNGEMKDKGKKKIQPFGYRFNIWEYAAGYGNSSDDEIAYEHPAIFPEQLAADHIYTWSNENDIVYDPFSGSGTTLKMAHIQKRRWVGSETSEKYVLIQQKRLAPYIQQYFLL